MPTQQDFNVTSDLELSQDVKFVADVHLIRILGEQLIGTEKVGILELIKNAYDAGASECHVWIEKVPGLPEAELSDPRIAALPGPVISILDNGRGMNEETIRLGWLRPATRIKTSVKERLKQERKDADKRGTRAEYESLVNALKKEHGGRLPLGEKGVGRFAAHRLGRYLQMQTKMSHEPYEWVLSIDWNLFDEPEDDPRRKPLNLDDVSLKLTRRLPERDYGPTGSGTMIRVYGGREGFEWTEEKLYEIGQAIARLMSPAKSIDWQPGFDVRFHCPQLTTEIGLPTDTVQPPFECVAIVDEYGKAEIEILFTPPNGLPYQLPAEKWSEPIDLRTRPPKGKEDYWLDPQNKERLRTPECGPFTLEIKLWLRIPEWVDYADYKEFTAYLDTFGGIGVYRDGLGIVPAQVASRDDWLGLAQRHIQKGTRISYYQMSGSVDLIQEETLGLVDRTSREGLLETRAFLDLGNLVLVVVYALERRVNKMRERYNRLKKGDRVPAATLKAQAQQVESILARVASEYDFKTDALGLRTLLGSSNAPAQDILALQSTLSALRREVDELTEQSDALLEAAGYGIAIGVAVHEIEKIASNLYFGLGQLFQQIPVHDTQLRSQTHQLSEAAKSLANELKRLAPLRVTRLEKRRLFNVRDCVMAASGAFRLTWHELEINFYRPSSDEDFVVMGSFGACSQVFANLFDNATYWIRTSAQSNRRITVRLDKANRRAIVADSGPGIDDKMQSRLFEPFHSLKSPPSGLGLYICRYYMRQMNGAIRESFASERIPGFAGAQFTLQFPLKDTDV